MQSRKQERSDLPLLLPLPRDGLDYALDPLALDALFIFIVFKDHLRSNLQDTTSLCDGPLGPLRRRLFNLDHDVFLPTPIPGLRGVGGDARAARRGSFRASRFIRPRGTGGIGHRAIDLVSFLARFIKRRGSIGRCLGLGCFAQCRQQL